jgi:hypothetical protein
MHSWLIELLNKLSEYVRLRLVRVSPIYYGTISRLTYFHALPDCMRGDTNDTGVLATRAVTLSDLVNSQHCRKRVAPTTQRMTGNGGGRVAASGANLHDISGFV